jgi:16S rRNA (cytosine967-C5)-methyltransferase
LLAINNTIAPLTLRVNTLRATREEVLAALRERGLNARAGVLSPDAILVENSGDPTAWPEWNAGKIIAQDEGAQLVSIFADPQSGQTVIDACAAPGGKSTHLAQRMKAGHVIAVDFAGRIKLVQQNAARLKLSEVEALNFETREGDFRELSKELSPADVVLLDAPCLGTGTLRRRPDAKWNKTPEQLQQLLELQRELLHAAARVVKAGGVLIYSTCSLETEENVGQVEKFLAEHPNWQLDGTRSTLPHRDGCDGAFMARLHRVD